VAAVDQDEMDALKDLKAANDIITTSFKNDLLMLQNKHKTLSTDYEQQKTQLIDALLSKDRLMKDLPSFKEQTGTNGDDAYQKAQSKAIIEEENSRRALQEVSKLNSLDTGSPNPPKRAGRIWKTLSRLSLVPQTPTTQAFRLEPPPKLDQAILGVLELTLERERPAIGSLPEIPPPLISPRTIPLPASPSWVRSERTDLKRCLRPRGAFGDD
jgi:protein HOOK3